MAGQSAMAPEMMTGLEAVRCCSANSAADSAPRSRGMSLKRERC
jgi:hypothetical protein